MLNATDALPAALTLVALLPAIWLLTFYRARVASVGRAVKRTPAASASAVDSASVVVCSGNDAEALERLLDSLFAQEFDGQMEVIVVNDGKSEDVKDVVTRMKHLRHLPNLYITFTPPGARNVSHRKLSITLGVKAAHYPVVVLIDEQASIPSRRWLAAMMSPFADPDVQIVLGSALPDHTADVKKGCRRYRAFTHAADAVAWLSAALRGAPYRGCGGNLAYRTDFFFRSKGFSSALNLRDGDDDIFINRVATGSNTAVMIAPETLITYSRPSSRSEYRSRRPRRFFTAAMLRRSTPLFFGFSSLMAWLFAALSIAAIVLAIIARDWTTVGVAATVTLGVWLGLMFTWRGVLRALGSRPALLTVPCMMLRRPFTNIHHKWLAHLRRKEYYTWG